MSDTEYTPTRRVKATGSVSVPFDRVNFTVKVQATCPNSTQAKAEIQPIVETIQETFAALVSEGIMFDEERTTATVDVDVNYAYIEGKGRVPNGYTATYSTTVQSADVDRSTEILDALTNVEHAQVQAPDFRVLDTEVHFKEAFRRAVGLAKLRFNAECDGLNLNPDVFKVVGWDVSYEDSASAGPQPVAYAAAMAAPKRASAPIAIQTTEATISASITLSLRVKDNTYLPFDLG